MTTLDKAREAVKNMTPKEFSQFRRWFEALDAEIWDKEFESDVRAGRLSEAADEALAECRRTGCRDL